MDLYLVRHGAASDTAGRCIGHCDVPLSPAGAEAIARVAAWLPRRPDRIVSSDLARARASADIVARHWDVPVAGIDARLREMNFGEWDGVPWATLEQRDGARLRAWMEDWVRVRAPAGESFEDVVARAGAWLAEARVAWRGETVVAVAHAGAIRALLCTWLAAPLDWAFRLRVEPASVSVVGNVIESSVSGSWF